VSPSSPFYPILLHALFTLADSFIAVVQQYVGVDGQLSEQFERSGIPTGSAEHDGGILEDSKKDVQTGEEVEAIGRGARDLTWSYAAWITASEERERAKKALAEVEFAIKGKGREPF
jgi:glucoamylase